MERKTVTGSWLYLIPLGLIINYCGAKFALHFGLPVFFDSIGTICCAALGGYLPGIIVGFFSNVINGISDPITMYYGILSILIAFTAAYFSQRHVFRSAKKSLLAVLAFAAIGGGLGSVLTWLLYGFNFGSGISAPYAIWLYEAFGFSKFAAQFTADMVIDLIDKLLTVFLVYFIIRILPDSVLDKMPLGYCNRRGVQDKGEKHLLKEHLPKRHSLKTEILALIIGFALVLGSLATTISFVIYKNMMTDRYIQTCNSAVALMQQTIDANEIEKYLQVKDETTPSYVETEKKLIHLRDCFPDIEYMYVYQIKEDGCHVVFDLDTEELPGEHLGNLVPHDNAFTEYRKALIGGEEIEPVISNETYGWLLTVYKPLKNSGERTVAYAAVDVAMDAVRTDRFIFIIRMITMLFATTIVFVVIALLFAEKRLIRPINSMTRQATRFTYSDEEERARSVKEMRQLEINTGNELQTLHQAMTVAVSDIARYISTIDRLQSNTLLSFAAMVESRDENTGEHIKRTALFVKIIAEQLRQDGKYPDILTEEYIKSLEKCAPLHDVGKVKISDTLLNKPGKLTEKEFAVMKTHTTAGQEIMRELMKNTEGLDYLTEAGDMAGYHHERWDGEGYPAGLKGEEIPLCARLMAVADVYDALISKRSYKDAFSQEKAKEIILSESGSHFDPVVVEAFVHAFTRLQEAAVKTVETGEE